MANDKIRDLERLKELPPWEWPADARETILACLAHEDAGAREAAAYMASALVDDQVAEVLLARCQEDEAAEVAGAAAIALAPTLEEGYIEFGDGEDDAPAADPEMVPISLEMYRQARETLRAVYQDQARPKLTRRQALEASVRAFDPWQEEAVRACMAAGDPEWRLTGVYCMAFVPGFQAEILQALEDHHVPVRRAALMAAGEQEVEAAGPAVLAVARDQEMALDLRVVAIEALAHLNPPGSEEYLSVVAAGADEDLAEVAEDALAEREAMGPAGL